MRWPGQTVRRRQTQAPATRGCQHTGVTQIHNHQSVACVTTCDISDVTILAPETAEAHKPLTVAASRVLVLAGAMIIERSPDLQQTRYETDDANRGAQPCGRRLRALTTAQLQQAMAAMLAKATHACDPAICTHSSMNTWDTEVA